MVGSAATLRTTRTDILKELKLKEKKAQGQIRENFTGIHTADQSLTGFSNGGSVVENSPLYFKKGGDEVNGPIAIGNPLGSDNTVSIDANGIIDIGVETTNFGSSLYLDSGGSLILDTIANAHFDGQLLWLKAGSNGLTIAQHTAGNGGNIQALNGTDMAFDIPHEVLLKFDAILTHSSGGQGVWRVQYITSGSGGGDNLGDHTATQDLDMQTFDIKSIDRLLFADGGDPIDPGDIGISHNAAELQLNIPTSHSFVFTINGLSNPILKINDTTVQSKTFVPFDFTSDLGVGLVPWNNLYVNNIIMSGDLNMQTFDIINIDRLKFDQTTGDILAPTETGITSNAIDDLSFNVPGGSSYVFGVNGDIGNAAFKISANIILSQNFAPINFTRELGSISIPWNKLFVNDVIMEGELQMNGNKIILGINDTYISGFNTDKIDFLTDSNVRMSITNTGVLIATSLSMLNLNRITDVVNPINPQDVVTKNYGDANYLGGGSGIPDRIEDQDTNVSISNINGDINFFVNGTQMGNIDDDDGWVIDSGDLLISDAGGRLNFNNGFSIRNSSATITTFAISDNKALTISEGGNFRIQIAKDIEINCDSGSSIFLKEDNVEIMKLSTTEITITATPLVMVGSEALITFPEFTTSAATGVHGAPPLQVLGYIEAVVTGVGDVLIPFYDIP